jgi:hypothetical protein
MGRGDRKGAYRVAAAAFVSCATGWALQATYVATLDEAAQVLLAVTLFGFVAAVCWLAYVAVEPFARKHWPDSLISWNRLLAGRLRDPLVASHVLGGSLAFWIGVQATQVPRLLVPVAPVAYAPNVGSLNGASALLASLANNPAQALALGLETLFMLVLLRPLLRLVWVADLVFLILFVIRGIAVDYSDVPRFIATASGYLIFNLLSPFRHAPLGAAGGDGVLSRQFHLWCGAECATELLVSGRLDLPWPERCDRRLGVMGGVVRTATGGRRPEPDRGGLGASPREFPPATAFRQTWKREDLGRLTTGARSCWRRAAQGGAAGGQGVISPCP